MIRISIAILLISLLSSTPVRAEEAAAPAAVAEAPAAASGFSSSGLKVPRFVSLKAGKSYVRTGPALRYPIRWVYKRAGLPVEIIQEFDSWRKIRDSEGDEGWIHQTLLSGARQVLIKSDELVPVYKGADKDSRTIARLEPEVVAALLECSGGLCQLETGGYKGWVERKFLWGIYDSEELN